MRRARGGLGIAALIGILVALGAGIPSHAASASPPFTLIPGQFTPNRQPDGNTIVFEDRTGLIVVDTGRHPDHQAKILALARARGKPISTIVNTHWHLDHSSGNRVIRAAYPGVRVYTSNAVAGALDGFLARSLERGEAALADPKVSQAEKDEVRLGVETIRDRRDLLPDVPVTGTMTIPYRSRGLELHLASHAATAGDTWIYDPSSRTLVAGDLVVIPVPFFDTACADGWRRALGDLAKIRFDRLIPGHGPILTRRQFDLYRAAFGKLVDCAESSATRQSCIDGWQSNAAAFIRTTQDRKDVQAYLGYYLIEVIRSADKQREFCGTGG